jgi:hypothetical protein
MLLNTGKLLRPLAQAQGFIRGRKVKEKAIPFLYFASRIFSENTSALARQPEYYF